MKQSIIALLCIAFSMTAFCQARDCGSALPKVWKFKNWTLTPRIEMSRLGKYMLCTFDGDSTTGFSKRYLGAAMTDSVRWVGYHREGFRMDPDCRLLWASMFKDSCAAKHAFWRMVDSHPKHK